jgi:hypothetical protein
LENILKANPRSHSIKDYLPIFSNQSLSVTLDVKETSIAKLKIIMRELRPIIHNKHIEILSKDLSVLRFFSKNWVGSKLSLYIPKSDFTGNDTSKTISQKLRYLRGVSIFLLHIPGSKLSENVVFVARKRHAKVHAHCESRAEETNAIEFGCSQISIDYT